MWVTTSTEHGWSIIVIENERLKLRVIPDVGAKVLSLRFKPTEREWLHQVRIDRIKRPTYGDSFVDRELGGFDDMCPTIDSCHYPSSSPALRVKLPDHGELWSVPWEVFIHDDDVIFGVRGRALPYEFQRTVRFISEDIVEFAYSIRNHGRETIHFLWAAHPLFAVDESTEIILPDNMRIVRCVYGDHRLSADTTYSWPTAQLESGQFYGLSRIGPPSNRNARKFYYPGRVPKGWSALYSERTGDFLICHVSPAEVPYLGVWIDEGLYASAANCALEPTNAYYDSLERAVAAGTAPSLTPGEAVSWRLRYVLGTGNRGDMIRYAEQTVIDE